MSDDAYDLGAEQSLLGSVLRAPDTAGPALLAVPPDAWWQPRHAEIAAVLTGRLRRAEPIDPQLVLVDLLGQRGFGSDTGPYLITLLERAWSPPHAASYADRVLRCAARRNLSAAGIRMRQRLTERWISGGDEPITDITAELRAAADEADAADAGFQADQPSPSLADLLAGRDEHDWLVPGLLERGERIVLTGMEGLGKALALDTAIPTPKGWTTMGALSIGDEVFSSDGTPVRIVAATQVMHGRPCYRVRFADGAEIVADANHLWLTETLAARQVAAKQARRTGTKPRGTDQRHKITHRPAVVSTRHMSETLKARRGHAVNHSVVTTKPLQYPAQELPVDPYVLGAWLGDGTTRSGGLTSADKEIVEQVRAAGYTVTPRIGAYQWLISRRDQRESAKEAASALVMQGVSAREARRRTGLGEGVRLDAVVAHRGWSRSVSAAVPKIRSFAADLRTLGVLGDKHIPETYQRASVDQRLALVQGLMDTDGTIGVGSGRGRGQGAAICEFSVVHERLARDVRELLLGLGIKSTWRSGPAVLNGQQVGTRYRLAFQTDLPVFRLTRKASRLGALRTRRAKLRYVVAVDRVESVPVRCVQIERKDGMFVAGRECIPTHNSVMVSQIATCLAAGLHPFTGTRLGSGGHELQALVVDCENGVSQSRRRFRNLVNRIEQGARPGSSWQQNLRIELCPNGLNLLGPDAGWLERKVAADSPDLLVVGPLYRLHYANMNDETAARDLVRVLDGIRTRYGCALLTEAHPGHTEDGAGNRRMRPAGSSLFLRWPEFGFGLAKAKGAEGEHPSLVDVVAWRGSREERQWPRQLKHGSFLPWEPANQDYYEEAA